jgi:hypothetical protein
MLIYDGIYVWEGWGGKLRLASGECHLRIFNLEDQGIKKVAHLRPIIVVVRDVPSSRMSVRSVAGHIATKVSQDFQVDPQRMLYLEHYPQTSYGERRQHVIAEKYDMVEFRWLEGKALEPKWRSLNPSMLKIVKQIVRDSSIEV